MCTPLFIEPYTCSGSGPRPISNEHGASNESAKPNDTRSDRSVHFDGRLWLSQRAEADRGWGWGIGAGIATALILGAIYRHHHRHYYSYGGYPYYGYGYYRPVYRHYYGSYRPYWRHRH